MLASFPIKDIRLTLSVTWLEFDLGELFFAFLYTEPGWQIFQSYEEGRVGYAFHHNQYYVWSSL